MRREARTFAKTARVLTDPEPEFVSLVKTGANKTPFKAVRCDDHEEGAETMQVRQRTRSAAAALDPQPIHPLKESVVKAEGYEIAAIEFTKGDHFADETAVKAWLDDGGYADYEIEAVDTGWKVSSKAEFDQGLRTVSSGKGFSVTIGRVKAAEPEVTKGGEATATVTDVNPGATEQTGETAAKTEAFAEIVKKFDYWEASESIDIDLASVLEKGNDGYPAGLYELTSALYTAIRNSIFAGSADAVRKACADYGEYVVKLAAVFSGLDQGNAEMVAKAEALLTALAPDLAVKEAPKANETVQGGEGTETAEKSAKSEGTQEATTEAKSDLSAVVGELQPMEIKEVDFTPAIKAAMEPFVGLIEKLTSTVSELTVKVSKGEEEAKARLDVIEARVTHPARKGADVGDLNGSTEATQVKKTATDFLDDLAARSLIGATSNR